MSAHNANVRLVYAPSGRYINGASYPRKRFSRTGFEIPEGAYRPINRPHATKRPFTIRPPAPRLPLIMGRGLVAKGNQ